LIKQTKLISLDFIYSEHSNVQSNPPSSTHPSSDLRLLTSLEQPKQQKRTTENVQAKAASIVSIKTIYFNKKKKMCYLLKMHKAKLIRGGLLCDYKVSVITGNCNGASTNAPISIKLYGTNGCTDFTELDQSETHRVPFLKGQTDEFIIRRSHVGQLVGITIGHDQKDMREWKNLDLIDEFVIIFRIKLVFK
jgi:hypothetical protein